MCSRFSCAAGPGFEPRLTDSESAVLPLDDPAILFISPLDLPAEGRRSHNNNRILPKIKEIFNKNVFENTSHRV